MGYIQKRDRPKQWLARYKGPDGRHHSKSFRRKVDAEKWLTLEEGTAIKGKWVDPAAGTISYGEWAELWLEGLHHIGPKTRAGYEGLLRFESFQPSETSSCGESRRPRYGPGWRR
jgi:hypothetical protein